MRAMRATAHTNIALVKYWGKRPDGGRDLNLPAVGSLSMTLDEYRTVTVVRPRAAADAFALDGATLTGAAADRVAKHLDRVWRTRGAEAGPRPSCEVDSVNHVPTAAGLASSASGFAALTLAAAAALSEDMVEGMAEGDGADRRLLSALARRGSGSAARSLWGGFVRLDRGEEADGRDCIARPVASRHHWDLKMLIVHTTTGAKTVGSTGGMELCKNTSPYYGAWVASSQRDLDSATSRLQNRDLRGLGEVMEHSCFKMHASMWAARPPLIYWNGVTVEVMREVQRARADGLQGWATSDAGPHVKVLCEAATADALVARLESVVGVVNVKALGVGPDPKVEAAT